MNERLERIDGLLAASLVEIAELLGVSKQRPYQMSTSPGSLRRLNANGRSRLWSRREVTAWRRRGAPRSLSAEPFAGRRNIAEQSPKERIRRRFPRGSPRT